MVSDGPAVYIDLGAAVFMAVKPLVKIYLSIGLGYLMWKIGIIGPAGQKAVSAMILNIFMPCLIFYNVVDNIKDTDIGLLAVIWLTAAIFYLSGLAVGYLIYLVSPIPRCWLGGLLLSTMLNNVNDLPVAYVETLGKAKQIPSSQSANGVAYSVLFTMVFTLLTFNCGGTRLVAWDFSREDCHANEPTVPPFSPEAWIAAFKRWRQKTPSDPEKRIGDTLSTHSDNKKQDDDEAVVPRFDRMLETGTAEPIYHGSLHSHHSYHSHRNLRARDGPEEEEDDVDNDGDSTTSHIIRRIDSVSISIVPEDNEKPSNALVMRWRRFRDKNVATEAIAHFIEDLRVPQMVALISAITISMIPWVKRVFCNDPTQKIPGFHDPPDGNPPLDFLMDFFDFMSGASVPLGLMMLGVTIARLKVGKLTKGFKRTVFLICLWKLAILPIIGCAWISRIRKLGWTKPDNLMLPVVIAVTSGTPTATVQVYLTLACVNPDEESMQLNSLAVTILAQYFLLPVPMGILVTYVLKHYV